MDARLISVGFSYHTRVDTLTYSLYYKAPYFLLDNHDEVAVFYGRFTVRSSIVCVVPSAAFDPIQL
jgi:hypothetical protein